MARRSESHTKLQDENAVLKMKVHDLEDEVGTLKHVSGVCRT